MASNAERMASGQSAPPVHTSSRRGEVGRVDVVHVGQAVEQGGRAVPGGDPLAPDPLGHALGVDAVHDDRGPAGLRDEQRGEHRHVEDREREAVALAQVGPVARGSRPAPRRAAAGCAGCAPRPWAGRWCRWCRRCPRGRTGRRRRRSVRRRRRRRPRRQVVDVDHRNAGVVERLVREEQRGAAVGELPALLGRGQRPVDPDPHGAEAHGAVEGDDHVGLVGQAGGDAVAGADAEVGEGVGGPVGPAVELGVGEAVRPGDQRLAVGIVGQRPVEHPGDRAHWRLAGELVVDRQIADGWAARTPRARPPPQPSSTRVRSSRLSTLPDGLRGSASMKVTSFGTLNLASWPRQCSTSSSAVAVAPGAQRDEGHRHLAPPLVGAGHHGHLEHGVVLVEHPLDLGAGDVLAARHDHVLEPVDDEQVAVLVADADVAGVEPAAGERLGGGLRVAPVALEHLRARAARSRPARPAATDCPSLVPDVELEVQARAADAAELGDDAVAVEERVARDRLGEAVGVGEPRRRERALDALDQRDRHLLAAVDDHPHRRQVALLDVGQRHDGVDHGRRQPHGGDPRALELVDDRGGVEGPVDDRRCAPAAISVVVVRSSAPTW